MKNKKHQKKAKIRPLLVFASLAIISAGVVFGLALLINKSTDAPADSVESHISYNSPTEEEIAAGQNIKESNEEKNGQAAIVDYSIFATDASQHDQSIEIRAYIEGVIKDSGACTFTFKKDNNIVTKTSEAVADARHTNCTLIKIPVSDFPVPGAWSLIITYSFDNIVASSSSYTVEVSK